MSDSSESSAYALPAVGVFEDIEEADLQGLAASGEWLELQDDIIVKRGESQEYLYFVLDGTVSVLKPTEAEDEILVDLPSGSCFGEMAFLSGEGASATVKANGSVIIWRLYHESLQEYVSSYASGVQLSFNLLNILAGRASGSQQKIVELTKNLRAYVRKQKESNPKGKSIESLENALASLQQVYEDGEKKKKKKSRRSLWYMLSAMACSVLVGVGLLFAFPSIASKRDKKIAAFDKVQSQNDELKQANKDIAAKQEKLLEVQSSIQEAMSMLQNQPGKKKDSHLEDSLQVFMDLREHITAVQDLKGENFELAQRIHKLEEENETRRNQKVQVVVQQKKEKLKNWRYALMEKHRVRGPRVAHPDTGAMVKVPDVYVFECAFEETRETKFFEVHASTYGRSKLRKIFSGNAVEAWESLAGVPSVDDVKNTFLQNLALGIEAGENESGEARKYVGDPSSVEIDDLNGVLDDEEKSELRGLIAEVIAFHRQHLKVPKTISIPLKTFDDYAEFKKYQKAKSNTVSDSGFFSSELDQIVVYKDNRYKNMIVHEAQHYILDKILGSSVQWINEGFSRCVETMSNRRPVFEFAVQRGRQQYMERLIEEGNLPSLDYHLSLSRKEWLASRRMNYNVSWSIVYFLMSTVEGRETLSQVYRGLKKKKISSSKERAAYSATLVARYYPGGLEAAERDWKRFINQMPEKQKL